MPVVLVVGIIVILAGVFAVATGRGGELAYEHADHAPLDLGPVSATDVALLRPPTALWGYNMQVTDEALDRIARALRDRDIEIAYLQRQLSDLKAGPGQDDEAGSQEAAARTAAEEAAQAPRPFVPKHERPRAETVPTRATEAANEDSRTEPDNDDAVAAAEEQGW